MRVLQELKATVNRRLYNILYKLELTASRTISCSICPYHKNENRKHKPQKNWKRTSKRLNQYKVVTK